MFLIPSCIQKLLHVPVPQCIIIREFFCYTKVTKFLLEIMTLLSSANNIRSDSEFMLRGR